MFNKIWKRIKLELSHPLLWQIFFELVVVGLFIWLFTGDYIL